MNVWKIGSRWDDYGNPEKSILHIFLKYNIVFAGISTDYIESSVKKEDIIAVSDGLTIKAVGKVLDEPKYFSEKNKDYFKNEFTEEFEKTLKSNGIKYPDEYVIAFKVKLYKLTEKEYFKYQRGTFHKIHGTYKDIVKKALQNKIPNEE